MGVTDLQKCQINYRHYRFGRSGQMFRGPMPDVSGDYVSFIGGSETYGKFSVDCYPHLLEQKLGLPCANWGTPGAGPWFFLKDPVVLEALSRSKVCVISIMGAIPNSNRLYSVFKRRNARLRDVSEPLQALFPEIQHKDYRFANNLLRNLHKSNKANFKLLEMEIQAAWVARMKELLSDIETYKVLLWFSERTPEASSKRPFDVAPTYVTRKMLDEVSNDADDVIEVEWPEQTLIESRLDRVFYEDEEKAALLHPGSIQHRAAANQLLQPLQESLQLLGKRKRVKGFQAKA